MGAYSEIDIDRRYDDNPFEESGAPAQNMSGMAYRRCLRNLRNVLAIAGNLIQLYSLPCAKQAK